MGLVDGTLAPKALRVVLRPAQREIKAFGSHVSESFLAYQFLLHSKCLDGKEDWNLESGNLNLMTLGFQGLPKERGVETNHSSYF